MSLRETIWGVDRRILTPYMVSIIVLVTLSILFYYNTGTHDISFAAHMFHVAEKISPLIPLILLLPLLIIETGEICMFMYNVLMKPRREAIAAAVEEAVEKAVAEADAKQMRHLRQYQADIQEWLQRRQEADRQGISFDEPMPLPKDIVARAREDHP